MLGQWIGREKAWNCGELGRAVLIIQPHPPCSAVLHEINSYCPLQFGICAVVAVFLLRRVWCVMFVMIVISYNCADSI